MGNLTLGSGPQVLPFLDLQTSTTRWGCDTYQRCPCLTPFLVESRAPWDAVEDAAVVAAAVAAAGVSCTEGCSSSTSGAELHSRCVLGTGGTYLKRFFQNVTLGDLYLYSNINLCFTVFRSLNFIINKWYSYKGLLF